MTLIDGNNFISHHIRNNIPCAVGKIGVVELKLLYCYLQQQYSPDVIQEGQYVAGIYPYSKKDYDNFVHKYTKALKDINALAIWNKILSEFEQNICNNISAKPIRLQDIEPYFHILPWSLALQGKKVLVISPFAESIQKQYTLRTKIWNNILPEFELLTIKYPNANTVDSRNTYKSTLDVIVATKSQMDQLNYDVALIGVGAASIPLTAHAKLNNKIGIHMGGATQILFGIKGKRWDAIPEINKFYNEYWIRPSKEETPEKVELVEGACYW